MNNKHEKETSSSFNLSPVGHTSFLQVFFIRSSHAFSCVHAALVFFFKLLGTCNLYFAVNYNSKSFTANSIHACPMSNVHNTVLSIGSNGHLKCPMEVLSADWLTRITLPNNWKRSHAENATHDKQCLPVYEELPILFTF